MQTRYSLTSPFRLAFLSLVSFTLAAGSQEALLETQYFTDSGIQAFCPQKTNPDLPKFEKTAAELQQTFDTVTTQANEKLKELAALNPKRLRFKNTIYAFENIVDAVNLAALRVSILKDAYPTKEVGDKATQLNDSYTAWFIDTNNNGGVYKVLKAYANTNPRLAPDEKKLMDDTIRTFKRNGLTDAGVVNPAVPVLQKEINELKTKISNAVNAANSMKNTFTKDELAGLTQEQLNGLDKEGDSYVILSGDRGTLRDVVMTYATKEETRKKAKFISNSRAMDDIDLVTILVQKRLELAKTLGYKCWADYVTEVNMAKTGATASDFTNVVSAKLRPLLEKELAAEAKYIVPGVNDTNNQVDAWDVYFFRHLYETNELKVDYDSLKKYFPYEHSLDGMFKVYEQVLGIKIEVVQNAETWHPDVKVLKITNNPSHHGHQGWGHETIGYVYLDMFPRLEQGKFNHFECGGLVYGKTLSFDRYRKPVAALICNVPVNTDGTPANLLYDDLKTIFHEFGHSLHVVMGKARFASQSGFNVPQDFVEVPSVMSEQWTSDPAVFKTCALPDPALTDDFIKTTLASIKRSNIATAATVYERQFGFDKTDFALHMFTDASQIPPSSSSTNLITLTNDAMASAYLPYPEGSGQLCSFLHILSWGYDAGYYSYAWSDSIVAELANQFEASPKGFMDPKLGMLYRKEILEAGASRDVNTSVVAFTGKPLDPERKAFLKWLGLE